MDSLVDCLRTLDLTSEKAGESKQKLQQHLSSCLSCTEKSADALLQLIEQNRIPDEDGERQKAMVETLPLAQKEAEETRARWAAERVGRNAANITVLMTEIVRFTDLSEQTKQSQSYQAYRQAKEESAAHLKTLALFCTFDELAAHSKITKESVARFAKLQCKIAANYFN